MKREAGDASNGECWRAGTERQRAIFPFVIDHLSFGHVGSSAALKDSEAAGMPQRLTGVAEGIRRYRSQSAPDRCLNEK